MVLHHAAREEPAARARGAAAQQRETAVEVSAVKALDAAVARERVAEAGGPAAVRRVTALVVAAVALAATIPAVQHPRKL